MRLAVVGLGAAGLAAAMACAESGLDVVGFEQSDLDNQEASSGGRGKVIRFGYDDPFFADLMRTTMTRWTDLAERTGVRLMDRHGGIHIGAPDDVAIVEGGLVGANQPYERLSQGAERLAAFGITLGTDEPAIFEPAAGVMWTSAVRGALASQARVAGAQLREHAGVEAVDVGRGGLEVRTRDGVEVFDRVIVSGGPWAFRLVPRVAASFTITRRYQLVFATDHPIGDGLARPWVDMNPPGFYGMINVAPGIHLIGLHELDREQAVSDPDDADDEAVRAGTVAQQIAYLQDRFGIAARPVDVRVCHYTSTASRDFVIDDDPDRPGLTLLSACSGHGFKFSITVGAYAAALAMGSSIPDRERFRRQLATMS